MANLSMRFLIAGILSDFYIIKPLRVDDFGTDKINLIFSFWSQFCIFFLEYFELVHSENALQKTFFGC